MLIFNYIHTRSKDRGYVLQTGRTIHQGTGKELLETEVIQKAFLGL